MVIYSYIYGQEQHRAGVDGNHTRIHLAANVSPRIIGLSATLGNPELARRFVCPENPASVDLITDPNSTRDVKFGVRVFLRRAAMQSEKLIGPRLKPAAALELSERLSATDLASHIPVNKTNAAEAAPIELQAEAPADEDLDEIADDIVLNFSQSTNLIFVNAKRTIEILAVKLHDAAKRNKLPADPFVVHHGSISKELREEAETQLKQGTPTTAICSSTLEMGIDIGSVRAVGQVDTPWSVASMVQRLGRSGRREGDAAIMRMYVRETSPHHGSTLTDLIYPDLLRAVALTRLMLQKWLEPPDIDRLHLSTLV
jgi:ATP-dependent Lhr-like helicase